MEKAKASNLQGTFENEFYIGKGDIEVSGQPIIGVRTSATGIGQYRNSGDIWRDFSSGGGFDVDTILVDDVTGAVLADDVTGNVLVNE